MSVLIDFPSELRFLICAHVYAAGLPPKVPTLDPLYVHPAGPPTSQPASYPPTSWTEPVSRATLLSLAVADHAWSNAARPWLWRRVEVRLPRSWLALVHEVVGADVAAQLDSSLDSAAQAAVQATKGVLDNATMSKMRAAIIENIANGPDCGIPVELLSPPASREPSRRRQASKSKSPTRWTLMRSISDAVQSLLGDGATYTTPHVSQLIQRSVADIRDGGPGRYIQHLDFNHFRTIGMRRSVVEGVNSRFVTGDRLEALLREMPNLIVFGATEYMDGALTLSVLKELFLRGRVASGRNHPVRGRSLVDDSAADAEDDEAPRRRECRELQALDASGCVSAVFVNALAEFVRVCLEGPEGPLALSGLQRVSFRGARSVVSGTLHTFVLACPHLTHLDLSGTRIEPSLLSALAASPTVHLRSLALGRCVRLTGESLHDFLVCAPAAYELTELSLYGDSMFPCPLDRAQLHAVLTTAPCFTAGRLCYLDLSSAVLDAALLAALPVQPALRSLGLSHITALPLSALATHIPFKTPALEVLTLVGSCPELIGIGAARQASLTLHARLIGPLCVPPFTLTGKPRPAPTRLRVIELGAPLLGALGSGACAWRVVRSKGGRGWYVDTSSGWIAEPDGGEAGLRRDLAQSHPWRVALEKLADANGNVNSGVGWHARKMEVLHGHGLLGREDGLYGAVSFAYQG
ncbi:hypothetical protein K488DRAFT_41797 [Vararia minispora EC-137]|uniref:Uncharacterized protein n=1 Tax=Vararia minispora EC-137 TaxID=1314806 RepID=A0ACB8QX77_9AGAM|nr:hypothetical protein K488DRAFT_41797 [Vararia minispora EC-137]